jgi:gliding motility-associated-like protein
LITGFVRGNNIDFDPGPGTYLLNAPGTNGTDPGHSGDIFLAKYTAAGLFSWAFVISGNYCSDIGEAIAVDTFDNIYLTGAINTTSPSVADADPGPGIYNLAGAGKGHAFVLKYTTNANFLWGIQLGTYGLNSSIKSIKILPNDTTFVVCGHHTSINADFDPGPGVYTLNSNGGVDVFVGKYSINGNFIWAFGVGGNSQDLGMQLQLDSLNNVYVSGSFIGTNVDFNPGAAVTPLSSAGMSDGYIAKYSPSGNLIWAKKIGSTTDDYAWSIIIANNKLIASGEFSGTVDFDPSPAVYNLTSQGSADAFYSFFDLAGNFECATAFGGIGYDRVFSLHAIGTDSFYACGNFSNTVDFNPSANTLIQTSNGLYDGFLVKAYIESDSIGIAGFVGDTICAGNTPFVTITLANGLNSTFNVQLSNGQTTYTYNNITSGVAFPLNPIPTSTTTYTIVGLVLNNGVNCNTILWGQTSATILITPGLLLSVNPITAIICQGNSIALSANGATNFIWSPATGLSNANIANPVASPTATTTYTITGAAPNACTATTTLTVVVNPLPLIAVLPSNPSICFGQSLPLQASGAMNYSWLPSTGLSNANIANPVASPSATTTYTVSGTTANGCSASTTVTINVGATLNIIANPSNFNLCLGQSTNLSCNSSATSYTWQPVTGLSNSTIPNPMANPATSTTYTVTGSNAQGCTGTATVNINVWPLPNIDVNPKITNMCEGDTVMLQFTGGLSYTFSPNQYIIPIGGNAAYVFPVQSDIYTITGYDIHNCSNSTSAVINLEPKPTISIQSAGNEICIGDSLLLTATGGMNYTWEPPLSVFPSNGNLVYVFPTQATTYTVTGTNANGCENTSIFSVELSSQSDFKVIKNRDIECGFNQAQLFASGADTYSWWPTQGLSNSNSATPIVQIDETTTFYVTGTKGPCVFTDSITVFVYKNNETDVFIPNAFSPNGDGVNDCVKPKHQANFIRYYFTVYNRFGNKVFSTYNLNDCWNGQYKNKDADVGNYFYFLKCETKCGEIFKKGDIMLMR